MRVFGFASLCTAAQGHKPVRLEFPSSQYTGELNCQMCGEEGVCTIFPQNAATPQSSTSSITTQTSPELTKFASPSSRNRSMWAQPMTSTPFTSFIKAKLRRKRTPRAFSHIPRKRAQGRHAVRQRTSH